MSQIDRGTLENVVGTEKPEDDEINEFDQEILDLGGAPGMGSSAVEADNYNFAVADIERRRAEKLREEQEEALGAGELGEGIGINSLGAWEDTSGERKDIVLEEPPGGGSTGQSPSQTEPVDPNAPV